MRFRPAIAIALIAAFLMAACQSAPAAPPLTDPKEILVKSLTSLQEVKTFSTKGTFGGTLVAEGMGNFDLSSLTLDMAVDVENKKARLQFDAPTLLGTNVDLIVVDDAVYAKVLGAMGAMFGADASGKYMRLPADAGDVTEDATDPAKAIEELRKAVDELPKAPVKLDDERCGDTDCYHVQISATGDELSEVSDEASEIGSVTFDLFTRKNDLRPARITFAVDLGPQGSANATFEMTYDQSVDVQAPPADQVVDMPETP